MHGMRVSWCAIPLIAKRVAEEKRKKADGKTAKVAEKILFNSPTPKIPLCIIITQLFEAWDQQNHIRRLKRNLLDDHPLQNFGTGF